MQGFNVASICSKKDLQVWVDFNDQVKVLVRYIPREEFSAIIDKATVATWDRKHQKEESLDNLKFGELLGCAAIIDWSGLVNDDKVFDCTDDNKKLLMRQWLDFAKFISGICSDLERLVELDKDAARKNLPTTSGKEATTRG